VQLRFDRLVAVLDLLLERLEPRKIALLLGDLQHDTGAVGADELVLEVDLADVEAEALHVRARQTRPEACTLERARLAPLLARVAQARHLCGSCSREKTAERLRTADRNDPHALDSEITSQTSGERLERDSIADSLDEDYGASVHAHMLTHVRANDQLLACRRPDARHRSVDSALAGRPARRVLDDRDHVDGRLPPSELHDRR